MNLITETIILYLSKIKVKQKTPQITNKRNP